ncbi:DUF362 domain-containing protein [Candidatus Bathyarchaeota archaeon]|nr:DUF362 domain-containing protein [Candidatus Bathyarchaeota archaeon]
MSAEGQREGRYLVSKVRDIGDIEASINEAVEKIGGFNSYINEGERVLIKPNYNSSDPPPATSDPEFIAALIRLLKKAGAAEVTVGESSMFLLSTRNVLSETGLIDALEREDANVVVFNDSEWVKVDVGENNLRDIKIPRVLNDFDSIVYSCCLKTHRLAGFSMSLKLGMGFTYPWTRIGWHLRGREEKIAEFNKILNPALILLDARKGFIRGGPFRGEVREPGLVMASNDRVAIDVEGIKIIQEYPGNSLRKNAWDYAQIKRSVELGLGSSSEKDYKVLV